MEKLFEIDYNLKFTEKEYQKHLFYFVLST